MTEKPERPDWKPLKSVGLMGAIGPLLATRDGSGWRYGLETDACHANAIGVIHGGTLTALVDQAISMVAWEAAERQPVVTVQLDTVFINSASPGNFLEVVAQIVAIKGSLLFMEALVTCADRQIVKASCVMKIARKRNP